MSGRYAVSLAARHPERVLAAASVYGTHLVTEFEDSPHRTARLARGELYFACAEHDDYAPAAMVDGLAAHLRDVGANARVEWYPGVHHGFAFPTRGSAYDRDAAERHWERLFALFARNLQS